MVKKSCRAGMVVLLGMLIAAPAIANVGDDQVTSQKIKEADGVSGQDTNSGSGVKTGHIQDGAVTDAKITGPISAIKIQASGLNADMLDGRHAGDLADAIHTHDGRDIIDGTITDAKISGPISAAKISSTVSDRVRIVQQSPLAAIDNYRVFSKISDAVSSVPADGYQYVVRIMPGSYTEDLDLSRNIRFEGSGAGNTFINGNAVGNYGSSMPTVFRDLTITGYIQTYSSIEMVYCATNSVFTAFGDLVIRHSTVNGDVGTMMHADILDAKIVNGSVNFYSYAPDGSSVVDTEISPASTEREAIYVSNSAYPGSWPSRPSIVKNVRVVTPAQYGIYLNQTVSVVVSNSDIKGTEYAIAASSMSDSIEVSSSRMTGSLGTFYNYAGGSHTVKLATAQVSLPVAQNNSGLTKVVNCYDTDFNAVANQ